FPPCGGFWCELWTGGQPVVDKSAPHSIFSRALQAGHYSVAPQQFSGFDFSLPPTTDRGPRYACAAMFRVARGSPAQSRYRYLHLRDVKRPRAGGRSCHGPSPPAPPLRPVCVQAIRVAWLGLNQLRSGGPSTMFVEEGAPMGRMRRSNG